MKETRHSICDQCRALSSVGYKGEVYCNLGYALGERKLGGTFMVSPVEPCYRPMQQRTLVKARQLLLDSGRRLKAVHHKFPEQFVVVKPGAVSGEDYLEFYKVKLGNTNGKSKSRRSDNRT